MVDKLSWGIISTGRIAGVFAKGLAGSKTGRLVAVASRSQEKADKFGDEYNVPKRYGSYEALLADPEVEAVYISTPHPMHAEWTIKAAEAGKHILCEKPVTVNYPEAMAVIDAVKQNNVFFMEAFMYRCNPQTAKLVELIKSRAIGEVRMIQASYGFHAGFNPESRLFNHELGGGGILDVGCYAVSMSRLVAGAAMGKPFADPVEVKAIGKLGSTGVDEWAAAILKFPGDIIAQVSTSVSLALDNTTRILGSEGNIFVQMPWTCNPARIVVKRNGQAEPQVIELPDSEAIYSIEADTVAKNIGNKQAPSPAMSWDDTLGNMRTLDLWREQIGLEYKNEGINSFFPTMDNRPLKLHSRTHMKYGTIDGIDKPVSRLIIGGTAIGNPFLPTESVVYDEYFRCGGNCFDTAYIYGGGAFDKALGQWVKNRGIRKDVIILAKGAHTPFCDPEHLTSQLMETLERLQTNYVDLYVMHRDNPEIPVGEFVDVLNEHKNAGRIRAFGGSNWTIDRIEAANKYAKSNGLMGFSAINNNFSLARMVNPVWEGCISASDAESRKWFEKTQMPLLAWSSLARGFFVRGDKNDLSEKILVDSWYSEDNFQRFDRVHKLAVEKGVEPVTIAMAYVLNQPFPVFPLFGPASLDELRISLKGLDVELTPDELRWLNLEA